MLYINDMKIRLSIVVLSGLILIPSLKAEEAQEVAVLKESAVKTLSVTTDFQWISGMNRITTPSYTTSSSFARFHVGAGVRLSDWARVNGDFPFGLLQVQTDLKALGPSTSKTAQTQLVTDRVKVGLEGKLFPDSQIGEISWNSRVALPTILGKVDYDNRFYNHTAWSVGLSDIYHFSELPVYALGSFSYITKFSTIYKREERDYGDEYAMAFGAGYRLAPKIHAIVQLQGSHVQPYTSKIMNMTMKSPSGATAVHVVPSISLPLRNNLSIRGQSRILLHRTQIDRNDSGDLWGSFEDSSEYSFQLGVRLGVI